MHNPELFLYNWKSYVELPLLIFFYDASDSVADPDSVLEGSEILAGSGSDSEPK